MPLFAALLFFVPSPDGLIGFWKDPTGSVIEIAACDADVCATLRALPADTPTTVDSNNPDAALHSRPLCGLRIGTGFRLTDNTHAEGGKLYDPVSGKTYSGSMTGDGDKLDLRGYVGFKIFGRSETWQRTTSPAKPCDATHG